MPELTCFRMLDAESPAGPLAEAVRQVNTGQGSAKVFTLDASSFEQVPNSPFAYWVEEKVRRLFKELPAFESKERTARQGLASTDNFRFVRCWWEVPVQENAKKARRWFPLASGGGVAPFFADIYLCVNWESDGAEIKENIIRKYPYLNGKPEFVAKNPEFYFKPGGFQTKRSLKLAPHLTPRGCVFSDNGFQFFSNEKDLLWLLGLTNSSFFESLFRLNVGKDETPNFMAGVMQIIPVPKVGMELKAEIEKISLSCWLNRRRLAVTDERSLWFRRPTTRAPKMADAANHDAILRNGLEVEFVTQRSSIETLVLKAYGDIAPIEGGHSARSRPIELPDEEPETANNADLARATISFAVGLAFGRWKSDDAAPDQGLPGDPLAELPQSPPGFAPHGQALYLVDDQAAGEGFVGKVLSALGVEFGADAEMVVSAQLDASSLHDYLIKPSGFFADHLAGYTKSRRQAPIYWPLSTKSGQFTLWVYYTKLDDQSLPKLIADVLSPKIRSLTQEIENRRASPGGKIGELEALRQELEEMRADFLDLINRGYRPNQNDGVLITACPLAKYFRHAGFRSKLDACWRDLARGDFDWAHLAMSMWPERVLEACKKDRSIAIAHGREDLCPAEPPKATRGRKKNPPSA